MKLIRVVYVGGLLCIGCDSKIDTVTQEITSIRNLSHLKDQSQSMQKSFSVVPHFKYVEQDLRNPFIPSSLADQVKNLQLKQVPLPNGRIRQRLEHFALDNLQFKGSIGSKEYGFIGLIQTPEGRIEQVRLGEYLGLNQGQVIKISSIKIDLIEQIPDGKRGKVKRRHSMLLLQKH